MLAHTGRRQPRTGRRFIEEGARIEQLGQQGNAVDDARPRTAEVRRAVERVHLVLFHGAQLTDECRELLRGPLLRRAPRVVAAGHQQQLFGIHVAHTLPTRPRGWFADGAEQFTFDGEVLPGHFAVNDVKKLTDHSGQEWYLAGLHMNTDRTWYSLSRDPLAFPAARSSSFSEAGASS